MQSEYGEPWSVRNFATSRIGIFALGATVPLAHIIRPKGTPDSLDWGLRIANRILTCVNVLQEYPEVQSVVTAGQTYKAAMATAISLKDAWGDFPLDKIEESTISKNLLEETRPTGLPSSMWHHLVFGILRGLRSVR